jgi:methylated-DNA-[protein]-cysteine S-methyltransferase
MTLAASVRGISGVWFDGQKHMPDTSLWPERNEHPLLRQAQDALHHYFAGGRLPFEVPLDLDQGTAFQQQVWRGLLGIAAGQTLSYAGLAAHIGRAAAVRAVGAAVGRNPISILVPCHRVLGADGSLTGYAGGLQRKAALLHLEHATTITA